MVSVEDSWVQSGRKRTSMTPPPMMSDLRIVLLGKCLSQTSRVSNSILSRSMFETEDPPHSRGLHCESLEGHVGKRHITLIITPHLLDPELSLGDLNQIIKECVPISKPGPHAFLLVVQSHDFTEEDRNRLKCIINSFSDEAINYSIVINTDSEIYNSANEGQKTAIHNLTKDCYGRHYSFPQQQEMSEDSVCLLFEKIDQMVKDNGGGHLVYESFEDAEQSFKTYEEPETIRQARFTVIDSSLKEVVEKRTLYKMLSIMANTDHLLHIVFCNQKSVFSGSPLSQSCSTDLKNPLSPEPFSSSTLHYKVMGIVDWEI